MSCLRVFLIVITNKSLGFTRADSPTTVISGERGISADGNSGESRLRLKEVTTYLFPR